MTILDKLHAIFPHVKDRAADLVLLGNREVDAYCAAMHLVYNVPIEPETLKQADHYYRGIRLLPVNVPSLCLVVHVLHEEHDKSIRV